MTVVYHIVYSVQGEKINLTKKFRCVIHTPKNKSQENSWDLFLFIQLACSASMLKANQASTQPYQARREKCGLLYS